MKKKFVFFFPLFFIVLISACIGESGYESAEEKNPTIGYIGCSNTRETVEGYHLLGGKNMWSYDKRYDSGSVREWAIDAEKRKTYWKVFDELLAENPKTDAIWFELCIPDSERDTSYGHAETVLNGVRKRIPEAKIYVSALADYTDGVCKITGTWGLEKGKELVKELTEKNEDVFAGPVLGPMTKIDTAKDGCHLSSPEGKKKLGDQMRLFFDKDEYSADTASVGYVGCSNTMQTIAAYWFSGGMTLWAFDEKELHQYDGGAVANWANENEKDYEHFWGTFDRYVEKSPNTKAIFWQLCIRQDEPTPYSDGVKVLQMIREKIPNATIYVSPLPQYTNGNVCEITGTEGIARAVALAKELDERNEDVVPGPELGPMSPVMTDKDGCHLSEEGLKVLGKQMRLFFDNETNVVFSFSMDDIGEDESGSDEETDGRDRFENNEERDNFLKERIDAAFEPVDCPKMEYALSGQQYKGILFDTHIHIPAIPEEPENEEGIEPLMGVNVKIDDYICMLDSENTSKVFAFFPVWDPIADESIEIARRTMEKYPDRFVPFIMPPDNDNSPDGFPTVNSADLKKMLSREKGLFKGYGEIGLYARGDNGGPKGSPELPPDSERLKEIYPVVREHNLTVYFHLGEGQKESFERTLESNPYINFIFHGDQLIDCGTCDKTPGAVADILENHPNAYYGVDELYGNVFIMKPETTKEEFIAHFADYESLLKVDLTNWKKFIETHPDQVLWGTDRGWSAAWSLDPEVALVLNNYSRTFIGKLDPKVQEKFAYKNAEKLFGAGH